MRHRAPIAKNWLFEPYGACSLLELTWMHQLETLLIVLHENQWEDTLFQGSPELVSPSVKKRALGSRLASSLTVLWKCVQDIYCYGILKIRLKTEVILFTFRFIKTSHIEKFVFDNTVIRELKQRRRRRRRRRRLRERHKTIGLN